MSDNPKQKKSSTEEERIREILSNQFNQKAYWTFKEGVKYFLLKEDRNRFRLQILIDDSLFEIIKRDVETQNLETINSAEEIEHIINYDPNAEYAEIKADRSELMKAKIHFRNLTRSGSMDVNDTLSPTDQKDWKLDFFCSNIKIKPEILIIYIIEHIDLFSSELEIPTELEFLKTDKAPKAAIADINTNRPYTFHGKQIKSWEELELILISYDTIEVRVGGDSEKLKFQQLGMAKKQNPDNPKKVWETLCIFAQLDGKYPNNDISNITLENLKDRIAELNQSLKQFFNLQDSIYKNHYKINSCWELKFSISSRLEASPSQKTDPSIFEDEVESAIRSVNLSDDKLYQE